MRSSFASLWDKKDLLVTCSGLNSRGEPSLPLLIRHESGPLVLRVLARGELAP